MNNPKIIVMGAGPKRLSMISVDLPTTDDALALAQTLADHTGRTVTLRDGEGNVVDDFNPKPRN